MSLLFLMVICGHLQDVSVVSRSALEEGSHVPDDAGIERAIGHLEMLMTSEDTAFHATF